MCTQRRPAAHRGGSGIYACRARASLLILTRMPRGYAHHISGSGFSAGVMRALCTAHAGYVARIHRANPVGCISLHEHMIRTLELVLHSHGMHSSFLSQPYNTQCMLVTATAYAVHACHGHGMHDGHVVHQAGHRHTTSSLFRLMR